MRVRYAIGVALTAALLVPAGVGLQAQKPAPAPAPAAAPTPTLKKMAPPLRGQIEIGYSLSQKRDGTTIVSTFKIKNLSTTGSIVGLQITEFWYDKSGNPVQGTGDRQRLKMPLGPGEVGTIVLKSPVVPGMTQPQYKFAHSNGDAKPKKMTEKELAAS